MRKKLSCFDHMVLFWWFQLLSWVGIPARQDVDIFAGTCDRVEIKFLRSGETSRIIDYFLVLSHVTTGCKEDKFQRPVSQLGSERL